MMYFPRPSPPFGNAGIIALLAVYPLLVLPPFPLHAQAPSPAHTSPASSPSVDQIPDHGYLGIQIVDVDADKAQALRLKDPHGAVITLVDHDAPAGKIGLHVNDVVVGLNGQPIKNALDLRTMIRGMAPGSKISLQFLRDGSVVTQSATLADRRAMEREIWGRFGNGQDPEPSPPHNAFLGGSEPMPPSGLHMSIFTGSLKIGVMVEPLTQQMAEMLGVKNGLMVKQVDRKSEAATAGLHAMDVILKVDADPIVTSADWDRALRASAGMPMQITILRDKKEQTLTLQLEPKHRGAVEPQQMFGEGDGVLVA